MIRIVIENLLLFLLPALIYFSFAFVRRRGGGDDGPLMNDAPLIWLCVLGVMLMLGTLVFFETTSGGKPGQAYEPPVYKNGKIEPGHMVK